MRCNLQVVNRANTSFPVKPELFQRTVSKVDLAIKNRLNSLPRILVCNSIVYTDSDIVLIHRIKTGPKRSCPKKVSMGLTDRRKKAKNLVDSRKN